MTRRALLASPTPPAQAAAEELRAMYDWVPVDDAELVIALGGDGFMLHTLHAMLERRRDVPVFGMNLGTVGFLMNDWRLEGLDARLARAKPFKVSPLAIYPPKGRATGGVRCQRLLKGEDAVILAWVGDGTPLACATSGSPVDLPEPTDRRDGSGVAVSQPVLAVSSPAAQLPGTHQPA